MRALQMRDLFRLAFALIVCAMISGMSVALPLLHADGTRMVNDRGELIVLRGCNLGNWLLNEAWMLKWNIADQAAIERAFAERFGDAECHRLMELYRENFITPRDFERIKTFEFNCVRVPFNFTLMLDDSGRPKPDPFKWLDRALQMAEDAGIYVILDMHGVPGRQSKDQCAGESGKNLLWSEPKFQQQMADLWHAIATRYKDRSIIAAYDLCNEPFGDYRTDMREPLRALMPRIYQAVRSAGDNHVVLFPQALGHGISFYDEPSKFGMTQVGFTDHYYAGLFGSPSTIASHAGVFARTIPDAARFLGRAKGPMLLGEFNVVLRKAGGDAMMRRYYDECARRGWMATMWSYKILKPAPGVESDNWYMATNANPINPVDPRTSSLYEIETFFSSLKDMPLAIDEEMRKALTDKVAPPMPLPEVVELPASAPLQREWNDWKLSDIDTSTASGVSLRNNIISVFASGSDIFNDRDSFAFLSKPCGETATLSATLTEVIESDAWAKAGLMIRFGDPASRDYSAAPFVMIHAFPNGQVAFTERRSAGAVATEAKRAIGPLPRKLMLVKKGAEIAAYTDSGDGRWVRIGETNIASNAPARMGPAVCSHRNGSLTRADFTNLVESNPAEPIELAQHANTGTVKSDKELLQNPSFEIQSDGLAASWNHWGDQLLLVSAQPKSGNQAMQFKPADKDGDSGLWQDVQADVGANYELNVFAHREDGDTKDQSLTIALEAEVNGIQVALAERSIDFAELESTGGWSRIHLRCAAISPNLRVLVRSSAKHCGVVVDDVSLARLATHP